jgi:enediyne biosynthesis protein E4
MLSGNSPLKLSRRKLLSLLASAGAAAATKPYALGQIGSAHPQPQIQPKSGPAVADFVDVAAAAGLTVRTTIGGAREKRYILETTGGGVALFDYDNDGWLDIFFVNGATLDAGGGQSSTNKLYKNNRDGTFTDVTSTAGLARHGWGQGVCVGDYNADGWLDLFVTYYGRNVLYRNNGNGTFTDVTKESGLSTGEPVYSTGAAFLDYDRDGYLDLFVTHYLNYNEATTHDAKHGDNCKWRGVPVMCGPRGLKGGRNTLYRNRADGTFEDVSDKAGVRAGEHYGFTVLIFDYDNDGWPDIYVANDSTASLLYHNNRNGTFTEVGGLTGVAYNEDGRAQSGMGTDAGDYDGDGFLDVVKTNFEQDTSTLYHNRGDGTFDDVTFRGGLGGNTSFVGWGTGFLDFDNDGWPDLFMANGHVYPEVDNSLRDTSYRQRKILYRNRTDGAFEDVSARGGPGISLKRASRGVAFGDLFNTGQTDILISNMNDTPTLLRNQMSYQRNALSIQLEGNAPNKFAIGARVTVLAGSLHTMNEVRSGGTYLSQSDLRLRFGLGNADKADRVIVKWPDGHEDTVTSLSGGHLFVIAYGGKLLSCTPYKAVPLKLRNRDL